MVCSQCRTEVPGESTFCLRCGTRLVDPERLAPVNGGGTAHAPGAAPDAAVPDQARRVPASGGKQAYALSFKPIADERLRYRLARWVCERASAHPMVEVQEGLLRGDFVTFLAMTGEEAEAALAGIQRLGAAPALVSLTPATVAQMLLPERRAAKPAPRNRQKDWIVLGIALASLFVFGLIVMRLFSGRGF